MIALALLASAWAGSTLEGGTGLVVVPTAETTPFGGVRFSLTGQGALGSDGSSVVGLPVGFAAGLTRDAEVGGHIARDAWAAVPARFQTGAGGFHLRVRVLDPEGRRVGLAVQPAVRGLGQEAAFEAMLVATWYVRGTVLGLVAGPRVKWLQGPDGYAGAGVELGAGRRLATLLDTEVAVDETGPHQWSVRAAVRGRPRDRVELAPWVGGGFHDALPWAALGVSLTLASQDGRDADGDSDRIPDIDDLCRYLAEDHDDFQDSDGCPEPDNDGDGIPDELDPTPNGEAPKSEWRDPSETPGLKMRVKPRPLPGPINRGPGQ